jgi:hypothetical protein
MTTTFSNKTIILADLWLNYRDDEEFQDFIEYNDLGLPLAYAYANGILTELTSMAESFIEEAWNLLLAGMELEDTGFETLDDLLEAGAK